MKKRTIVALVCALALVGVCALAGCSNDEGSSSSNGSSTPADPDSSYTLVTEGTLTVAASLDFPPFENLENGEAVGFSIDIMDLLGEEMGLDIEFLPSMKYDTIIPTIASGGKADIGMSSFTITEKRKKEIDFSDPYCDSNQSVVVLKDSDYATYADLEGKKIGAQSGTTGYDWAVENIAGADVVAFDEMTAVFAALQSGQIDGITVDLPVAQFYVKDAYTDAHVIEEIPTGEQYGIAVSKENPALTTALNDALNAIKDNGKYDELYQKWFG